MPTVAENDNRMSWIRHIEFVKTKKKKYHSYEEYELACECRITGGLDYKKGAIYCSFLTSEKDRDGLYHYSLRIRTAYNDPNDPTPYRDYKSANSKGYYFKAGIAEELISLFSVFFQCRFYVVATNSYLPNSYRRIRNEKDLIYKPSEPGIHPTIFSEKSRSFSIGLTEFLDRTISLPVKLHQDFLWASFQYSQALRQVGIDTEMVFIKLVSAIEILSTHIDIDPAVDVFNGRKLSEVLDLSTLDEGQKEKVEKIFLVRNSGLRFVSFIEKYCTSFFKGGKSIAEHCKIRRSALVPVLKKIYSARSEYLHNGESMYLSTPLRMKEARNWDTDPSRGMMIDNRSFSASLKLPFAHFFESLVRHCLINFLGKN